MPLGTVPITAKIWVKFGTFDFIYFIRNLRTSCRACPCCGGSLNSTDRESANSVFETAELKIRSGYQTKDIGLIERMKQKLHVSVHAVPLFPFLL